MTEMEPAEHSIPNWTLVRRTIGLIKDMRALRMRNLPIPVTAILEGSRWIEAHSDPLPTTERRGSGRNS